jgi:hypothetical protein
LTVKKCLCYRSGKAAAAVAFALSPIGKERKSLQTVITGFNTDIEHEGVVYHVQTEDKGLDTPIILSLVYVGGTILASKRSPYADLIEQGFSDEVLSERLKRQHRLICAAINSGRIDDLKKMSRAGRESAVQEETIIVEEAEPVELESAPVMDFEIEYGPITQEWTPPPPRVEEPVEEVVEEPAPEPEPVDAVEEIAGEEEPADGLFITMLGDQEFYSGEKYMLRVLVNNRSGGNEEPLQNVAVSIKILGTTFRPLIYSLKTQSDGVASVATQIPEFTSGRAAVLVRAVAKDQAAELRRIIHPAS